jgi:DNA topoisomerase-1
MAKALVIVESPAKARTIGRYLGKGYDVQATMGHVRDLPGKDLGVDVEHDFKPKYVVLSGRKKVITELKKHAAGADVVYLAPDLDREGEAIAWHVMGALKLDEDRAFRVTFNEITKSAIQRAFEHPGKIQMDKVNAQQARRLLDRLVGYQISPILWKRIPNVAPKTKSGRRGGLSAGRVQSVAVRLIVEREREIEAFEPKEFWRIAAVFDEDGVRFEAVLDARDGEKLEVTDKPGADEVLETAGRGPFVVSSVEAKETRSNPSPPFTTSTLQQSASTVLRFAAKRTMRIAQQLYEGVDLGEEGPVALITYMRTDSVRISDEAVGAVRDHIVEEYGKNYLPAKPRAYKSKGSAQEAHEAVRPTYIERTPESVRPFLSDEQWKLYNLIWRRAVASQMPPARYNVTTASIDSAGYRFVAKGRTVVFDGHTRLAIGSTSEDALLPALKEGQALDLVEMTSEQKFTQPPPRYTEAALVRTLEREGIGRPSTYATIISTIQERHYVVQEKRAFVPTALGVFLTDKLVKHFPKVLNVKFTSHMEEELDLIESGKLDWLGVLREFYGPFSKNLEAAEADMQSFEETDEKCPECGKALVMRLSKAGLYLACQAYPDCKYTRNLSATGRDIASDLEDKKCPACGKGLTLRGSARGPFVGCSGYPECRYVAQIDDPEGGAVPSENEEGVEAERICPDCGKPLVKRSGKRGEFWGCTGYPDCRHTEPLEAPEGGVQVEDIPERKCPNCGKTLVLKNGRRGPFLACPGFPKCKHAESIETADGEKAESKTPEEVPDKKCPNCGKTLVIKNGRRGPFLACPGYPDCKHAEPIKGAAAPKKAPPKKVGRACPECGKDLLHRTGKRGAFIGCSGYPKCRYTESGEGDS